MAADSRNFKSIQSDDFLDGVKAIKWCWSYVSQRYHCHLIARYNHHIPQYSGLVRVRAKDAIADYFRWSYLVASKMFKRAADVRMLCVIKREVCSR